MSRVKTTPPPAALLVLFLLNCVGAWTTATNTVRLGTAATPHKKWTSSYTAVGTGAGSGAANDNNDINDDGSNRMYHAKGNWLEEWSLEGAQKISTLDVGERMRRTLLAEMCEDEIYQLTLELEKLVDEETGTVLDAERAQEIAVQSRSLQQQYKDLVTGAPSTVLDAVEGLNKQSRPSRQNKTQQDPNEDTE